MGTALNKPEDFILAIGLVTETLCTYGMCVNRSKESRILG